jgi:hypothetical protein
MKEREMIQQLNGEGKIEKRDLCRGSGVNDVRDCKI